MPDSPSVREFLTRSTEETIQRGRELAAGLKPPVLILLSGELGAGKTTLTKGIVAGLGAAREEDVTSPTFTLIHKYQPAGDGGQAGAGRPRHGGQARQGGQDGSGPVYHIDLYRIGGLPDLETLGLDDIFAENSIVLVEWPDRLAFDPGRPVVRVHLEHVDEATRRISISGVSGD